MTGIGFRTIDIRPRCYTRPNNGLFMTVYVVDFKLVGPVGAVKSMWTRIAEVVSIEMPTLMERYFRLHSAQFRLNDRRGRVARQQLARYAEMVEARENPEGEGDGVRRDIVHRPVFGGL